MPRLIFELVRDARGSLVHVRHRQSGECVGCVEAGLFEIVRALVLEEVGAAHPATVRLPLETDVTRTGGDGSPSPAAPPPGLLNDRQRFAVNTVLDG